LEVFVPQRALAQTDNQTTSSDREDEDDALRLRIGAEFAEMPGLRLTLSQASRLFNLERSRCERVLVRLVNAGTLSMDAGAFVRAGGGRRSV
jgi:hypothetical protein